MVSGWLERWKLLAEVEVRPDRKPCSAAQLRLHTRQDVRSWRRRRCMRLTQACGLRLELAVGRLGESEDRKVRLT